MLGKRHDHTRKHTRSTQALRFRFLTDFEKTVYVMPPAWQKSQLALTACMASVALYLGLPPVMLGSKIFFKVNVPPKLIHWPLQGWMYVTSWSNLLTKHIQRGLGA